MSHIISKAVLIKTFLLMLGLSPVGNLFFRGLDKLNTHQQLVMISENDRKSIPIEDEMMLAAFEQSSKLKNDPHLPQTSLNVRTKSPNQSTSLVKAVFISVKDFGAIGNGIADDTTAIQKAIDTVEKSGGGVVFFSSGTYKVTINPSTSQAITIRSKLTLRGSGHKKSIIKLGDRQGNYNSILAGETYGSDLSDFAIYDIAIDGNSINNPVKVESDVEGNDKFRYALRIFVGKMVQIERCRFTNQNNVNTITVNGEDSISDITIKDNIFEMITIIQLFTHTGKRLKY
jgi:Pectate lyase superfamily protein